MMPKETPDLHAVLLGGKQMATAQQLLEHPKERLDQPPQPIHLAAEFSGQIEEEHYWDVALFCHLSHWTS
ncbi:MAG: hypothetical protein WCQ77_08645 [Planctomycetota bacterium]